ncbi:hypothetical protein MSG28_011222 [Choristoneura fumiferana]|uniref:Uncharacterized protein n=1 Tax=Choristoneura fumiferana TaxID=7141 RepID=A0ACC0KQU8_CHOFU|nr:hypothetical protein MSG28_011222 [Choristoneura fumiferana]
MYPDCNNKPCLTGIESKNYEVLEREIVNVFSAQKLQQFNKLYFENRNTLEREIPDEDEALYLIWAKNKSEDALCHSISADGPTTSDTLEQARYPSNDVTTAQTNDVVVTDEAMVIPLDAGDAVPTETEGMHFNSMQTENPPKDGNFNDLIETDSSAHNSKKHDAVIQPLPPPERSLPTHLSKDSLTQQPNNVPKNDTVTNQPVLIPEPTSPIGSAVVTGDPQRQQPDNTSTVNTLLDQALPPPNPSSSSSFPEVIGNDLSQQPIISTMEPQYTTPQKSLEKVLGVIVPSPFKRSLFWPENWMDSNKKRMKREKIPSTVTSKAWKEYHEKKETEKNKKQQEKDERARQRIEKKKLKEQLTNEKNNKSKIKKTKKTFQEDSTSEESDVEISYAESDISYNLEDDEEKITKSKNQIDCDSIDSDLENLPISKIASSKATKQNKNRKFSLGNFVIIKYEGEYFPGKIESLRKNEYEISTMTLTTGNSFKWPNPPDKIFYKLKEIMEVIKEPICLNKRGFIEFQKWINICQEKRNNSLKTGRKCKYDAADEIVYKIMEKNSASPTPDEVDPLETSGTSEDQVLQSIPTETSRSTPAVSPHSNASNSSQPRERLLTDNNDGNNGLRKRKMEVELELAEVKLEIAKRESYKLDLELLKLERELNITRHSTFTLPIVMQSDCKYANVIHGN